MPQYEYRIIRWFAHDLMTTNPNGVTPLSFNEGIDLLNRMGSEGWEVCGTVITNHAPVYQYQVTTLKRDWVMESIEIDDGLVESPKESKGKK